MRLKYICLLVLLSIASLSFAQVRLTIIHTNDTHSCIEPLPMTNKKFPGWAGAVNRAEVIKNIKDTCENVILIDAGDFVQGTPYFNLFHGRAEVDIINALKYDVVTLGNHEFDFGIDTMAMFIGRLNPPVINCNYNFTGTAMAGKTKPYVILEKFGLKIGIVGVGADPNGLIQKDKYEGMEYIPIVESVNKYANQLKTQDKCDLVICLSHIGYGEDVKLAEASTDVDLIVGGHSHTFMEKPAMIKNMNGKEVLIFQNGKDAAFIGKIDVVLDTKK